MNNNNDDLINLYLFTDKQISDMDKIDKSLISSRYINDKLESKFKVATTSFLFSEEDYVEATKEILDVNALENIVFVLENFNYLSHIHDEEIDNKNFLYIKEIESHFINAKYEIFNTPYCINTIFHFSVQSMN